MQRRRPILVVRESVIGRLFAPSCTTERADVLAFGLSPEALGELDPRMTVYNYSLLLNMW